MKATCTCCPRWLEIVSKMIKTSKSSALQLSDHSKLLNSTKVIPKISRLPTQKQHALQTSEAYTNHSARAHFEETGILVYFN